MKENGKEKVNLNDRWVVSSIIQDTCQQMQGFPVNDIVVARKVRAKN